MILLSAPGSATTFSGADFLPSNWSESLFTTQAGGSFVVSQVGAGGNPGSYRDVELTTQADSGAGIPSVLIFHGLSGATVDPSLGPITEISYSFDFLKIISDQGLALGILQNGIAYLDAFFITQSPSVWQTRSRSALSASDFGVFDIGGGASGLDFTQNPDLSASGAPIQLGFVTWLRCSSCAVPFTSQTGYDNFSVTVIPEPSTAILLGFGLLVLGRVRRAADLPG